MVPQPAECTPEAARAAFRYLADEWLCDVATNLEGKVSLIALALTLLQRHQLDERPGFFCRGGQRGSGKTTSINMIALAATGRRAAATPWSPNLEERRKALFAFYLEGGALCVFDNIARGSVISCPAVESALTSPIFKDRILGISELGSAPANGILIWNGNAIAAKGDLASRIVNIDIQTDRPDPENRAVVHQDPLQWTMMQRSRILHALYTLLLMPRPPTKSVTRFREWWRQVGQPLELVSETRFAELFAHNEETDEEANATASLLSVLWEVFPLRRFTSAEVARLIDLERGFMLYRSNEIREAQDKVVALRDALGTATGSTPFHPKEIPSPVKVGKRLKALIGRTVHAEGIGTIQLNSQIDPNVNAHTYGIEFVGLPDIFN